MCFFITVISTHRDLNLTLNEQRFDYQGFITKMQGNWNEVIQFFYWGVKVMGVTPKVVVIYNFYRWKRVFREKKTHFFGNKTVDQRSGANLKKPVFCKNLLQISCFFSFFAAKTLKMTISTSVWIAQHPSAGQNMQHLLIIKHLKSWKQRSIKFQLFFYGKYMNRVPFLIINKNITLVS